MSRNREAHARFRVRFAQAEINRQSLALNHQIVELGAMAGKNVAQDLRGGEITAIRTRHSKGHEHQLIRQVARQGEGFGFHGLEVHRWTLKARRAAGWRRRCSSLLRARFAGSTSPVITRIALFGAYQVR